MIAFVGDDEEASARDLLFVGGEEARVGGEVGDDVVGKDCGNHGREAFKDEEETPGSYGGWDRGKGICEEAGISCCERGGRYKKTASEGEFLVDIRTRNKRWIGSIYFAAVEEGEVERDTCGPKLIYMLVINY